MIYPDHVLSKQLSYHFQAPTLNKKNEKSGLASQDMLSIQVSRIVILFFRRSA